MTTSGGQVGPLGSLVNKPRSQRGEAGLEGSRRTVPAVGESSVAAIEQSAVPRASSRHYEPSTSSTMTLPRISPRLTLGSAATRPWPAIAAAVASMPRTCTR
jgi:hypothetical protein